MLPTVSGIGSHTATDLEKMLAVLPNEVPPHVEVSVK